MREIQARFFSKVGGLIGGGVPWLEAFDVGARSVRDDPVLHEALGHVVDRMREGHAPSDALAEEPVFSEEVVRTLRAGEDMGDLESKAMHVAEQLLSGAFEVGRSVAVTAEAAARLEEIVDIARASGGSHVHLEPTEVGGCARVRRSGRLADEFVLTEADYAELLAAVRSDCPVPASLATFREGEGAVLRLEPDLAPEDIEVPADAAERLRSRAATGRGLVLVAGRPAAARIALVRTLLDGLPEGAKVCAVSPDESLPLPVLHLEVEGDAGVPGALFAALEQDPDAIVLPAIEDHRTARDVVRAARRGALVIAGAPVADAAAAIRGLTTIGVDAPLVVDALASAAAIRLVRLLCPDCVRPAEPDAATRETPGLPDGGSWSEAPGCDACGGTGHRGRLALVEILDAGGRAVAGTRTLRDEALARAAAGEVSLAEALADGTS